MLGCVGFAAFVLSHLLGLVIGPWPSVLFVSAVVAAVVWTQADARPGQDAPIDEVDPDPLLSA
jgi:hypothetical protein